MIGPLPIGRQKGGGQLRLDALRFLGATGTPCIVADDDGSFTRNKRMNCLATIQEYYDRACARSWGARGEAPALNVNVKVIRQHQHLLAGIGPDRFVWSGIIPLLRCGIILAF